MDEWLAFRHGVLKYGHSLAVEPTEWWLPMEWSEQYPSCSWLGTCTASPWAQGDGQGEPSLGDASSGQGVELGLEGPWGVGREEGGRSLRRREKSNVATT